MLVPLKPSRLIITGLASSGALETGYLTLSRLTSTPVSSALCSSQAAVSCTNVLTGPYSVLPVANIPLVSVAFVAYAAVAVLSLMHGAAATKEKSDAIGTSMLFLTSSMATFSAYLMVILNFVIHGTCNYCLLSASISFAMAAIAWNSRLVNNATKAFTVSATSTALTTAFSAFIFYVTSSLAGPEVVQASTAPLAQYLAMQEATQEKNKAPEITTSSSPRAMELAKRLKALDARMYGAFWCSHCYNQKQELGKEAFYSNIPYIECDKEGKDSQYSLCREKKVPGYPTWEIKGQLFPGEKTLDELDGVLKKLEGSDG